MKRQVRTNLFPLSLLLFLIGVFTDKLLVFGIIGGAILIFALLFYSGRKQRIRYWIQGYKANLKETAGNNNIAIELARQEFCASKYADDSICNKRYQDIDILVQEIIKKEYKFEGLLYSPISSPESTQRGLPPYEKEIEKMKKELAEIKREVLN